MSAYTTAIARIPLDATGVYLPSPKGAVLTTGRVTLNAVNGVPSLTVTNPVTRKAVLRVKGDALRSAALSFPSRRDAATLAGFVR